MMIDTKDLKKLVVGRKSKHGYFLGSRKYTQQKRSAQLVFRVNSVLTRNGFI